MRVLVACEFSGIVREAFTRRGHDVTSCDLLPTEIIPTNGSKHYQGDIRDLLNNPWDLMIAHPPCTYLSRAGARWWKTPGRSLLADKAAEFVFLLRDAPIYRIVIENPIGQLNKRWRYPDQIIQPWQFGEPYSKATCLWLKNLPLLKPTKIIHNYVAWLSSNTGYGARIGQKHQPGVMHNVKNSAKTFKGIAEAMASQWSDIILEEI